MKNRVKLFRPARPANLFRICHIIITCTLFFVILSLTACSTNCIRDNINHTFTPTDIKIIKHHVSEDLRDIELLMQRLYLKNPKYEPDLEMRHKKLDAIFRAGEVPECDYLNLASNELLTMAFEPDCPCRDRIFILGMGLAKSIHEAYNVEDVVFISGVQIPVQRLERLYYNLGRVNWLLKTRRDEHGELLFLTNEAGENGYINMEYEKIFTRIITRTGDDIYMRDGLLNNFLLRVGTSFLSILTL